MKIVHLCLACFYPDGYSYQENMLPKFHKKLGYEVEIIASTQSFDEYGKVCFLKEPGSYQNEYDIKVTRLRYKSENRIWKKLKRYKGTLDALIKAKPDILFIHGCQFMDIDQVVKYIKINPQVKVYVDNHADFSNSATKLFSKLILHKIIWKRYAHKIEPYTEKFYGVLPARVDFLIDIYKLPKDKCELLLMGADDELVEKAKYSRARERIRKQYFIADDEFLVMTGGKIDQWKTQTLILMEAVRNIPNEKLKLIVFGSVTKELMNQVKSLADGTKVQYIGWVESNHTYEYIESADLFVFPGRHSVLWEQVVGQGIPMIVKKWPGTQHVDIGGNVRFLIEDSVEEIQGEIEKLLASPDEYKMMRFVAEEKGMKKFSYRAIALKGIEANMVK